MTRSEAIKTLVEAAEDTEFEPAEEVEIFAAIYGRKPDQDDRSAGLISLCYADPEVAAAANA